MPLVMVVIVDVTTDYCSL